MPKDSIIVHDMSTSNFDNAAYRNDLNTQPPRDDTIYVTSLDNFTLSKYYFTVAVGDAFVVDFSFDSYVL